MKSEPALTVGSVTALFTALLGMAVAFGADISDEQKNALLGAVTAAVPIILVMAGIIRQVVYSPNTVRQIKAASVKAGETDSPAPVVP